MAAHAKLSMCFIPLGPLNSPLNCPTPAILNRRRLCVGGGVRDSHLALPHLAAGLLLRQASVVPEVIRLLKATVLRKAGEIWAHG